ncbi:hypothetical protein GIS00_16685 [Nakamurella sp. YIM 132087]|uniref:Hydantoinase/oxoprolinase n=1 Tax=Nakamurella alba TaxID=2665158 RepID=A0A7K1FN27_9ACTN|nr:hypothetical protein [Nakamurella alba]MTD15571.1 hypothetical protein [Nakamurella alba]
MRLPDRHRDVVLGIGLDDRATHVAVVPMDAPGLPLPDYHHQHPHTDPDTVLGLTAARIAATAAPGEPALRVVAVTVDLSRPLRAAVAPGGAATGTVAAIRIVPRPAENRSLRGHPARSVEDLVRQRFTVTGGHDLFGRELRPLAVDRIRSLIDDLDLSVLGGIAVVGTGSQAEPRHERELADLVQTALPEARISVAGDFGGQGLVAREASVVLNAALTGVVEPLLVAWVLAVSRHFPGAALRIARSDGGWSTPAWIGAMPVLGLGARDSLRLLGAATVAGLPDCRILLPATGSSADATVGEVRRRLVTARPHVSTELGAELVVPLPVLTPYRRSAQPGGPSDVTERHHRDVPWVDASESDQDLLVCIGAAVTRPSAWLDEIAVIDSVPRLEQVSRDLQARATAIATANGVAPGSAAVVEMSTVAVPYSPAGTVRIRVRVSGPDPITVQGVDL